MKRRKVLWGISLLGIASLTGAHLATSMSEKPVIQLCLDATVSEVQAHSTYQFAPEFMQGIPGKEFITVPHVLIYQDDTLTLRIEEAGGLRTLPTLIGYASRLSPQDPESIINYLTVHILNDYVALRVALDRARKLQDELLAQGFSVQKLTWGERFDARFEAAPANPDVLENLEAAFLNSSFFAKSVTVFRMQKGHLDIELSLTNGRRKWGSRTDRTDSVWGSRDDRAAKEARSMSQQDLLKEPSYSLELGIGPTDEWWDKQFEKRYPGLSKKKSS